MPTYCRAAHYIIVCICKAQTEELRVIVAQDCQWRELCRNCFFRMNGLVSLTGKRACFSMFYFYSQVFLLDKKYRFLSVFTKHALQQECHGTLQLNTFRQFN